ncbi:hypothetical protein PV783_24885 [Chitinophaga sp. CC14]|uniref:hypothetical protein n=1 Tax=Chitinophaga sp. CC14 TaxID=3029199 RepID=UPI003B820672
MDTQLLASLKEICIEEAANFEVAPALIDVIIVKQLFKSGRRYLIPEYLQSGALFRLLENAYGPFTVLLDKDQPTLRFKDGRVIGADYCDLHPRICRWDALIYACVHAIVPGVREHITRVLYNRISGVFEPCYAA